MKIYRTTRFLTLGLVLRQLNADGVIVKTQSVSFANGQTAPKFIGGMYLCTDPVIADILDNHRKNKANGGSDFYLEKTVAEFKSKTPEKTVDSLPEKEAKEIQPEQEEEAREELSEKGQLEVYPEINTVQMAAQKLRSVSPDIKTIDIRTKSQIAAVALTLNISFPNL